MWATARAAGLVRRAGKINPFVFVWSLVLGFGAGSERTVSSLRRGFERAAKQKLVPSSFYDRFNAGLVELLRRLIAHLLATPGTALGKLGGSLGGFRDVVLADASVLRLRDRLEKLFPIEGVVVVIRGRVSLLCDALHGAVLVAVVPVI